MHVLFHPLSPRSTGRRRFPVYALALAALVVVFGPVAASGRAHPVGAHPHTAAPQGTSSTPPNVLVARGRTEPALALTGHTIVAAANPDYYHGYPNGGYNETFAARDGGAWTPTSVPAFGGAFTGLADPSLAADARGHTYYLYMGETPSFCGESGNVALLLARSSDGGHSFAPPAIVDMNGSDDKPFVAVDTGGGRTTIDVTFTRWTDPSRRIMFTQSRDGGRTFAPPTTLYALPGINMGSLPVVGPHGRLYVLWSYYERSSLYAPLRVRIMLRASADGGRSFAPTTTVALFMALPQSLAPGALRLFTFPTAGVDPRTGALYVAWVRARALSRPRYSGQMGSDLVLVRSRASGGAWSRPAVLNDVPAGDRFMPALSVGSDGVARVVFYDRRADGVRFALYGVAARDLGKRLAVWPNRRISATLSSPYTLHYIVPGSGCVLPGRFMGDYIAAATTPDGALDTMWTDAALGVQDETDLWFAHLPRAYLQSGTPRTLGW